MLGEATSDYSQARLRLRMSGGSGSWTMRGAHHAHDLIGGDTLREMGVAMHMTGREPTIAELLDDPIARLLMASDRLSPETVWECVRDARRKLKRVAARRGLDSGASGIDRKAGQAENPGSRGSP
jgi:hypothetical protein